ncbi:HupE / UreJ protein (plasmid) [Microvirga ossetica]|uniref:HupE / UreJ protein n=2 Tax=Microvirga ossetica TaxID=1882682 RepID=A0A1B2EY43_9HYPH|nr:HupE/UreJ family protein [Microvirga ossetica]ANY84881.1 HupE / UreJ protein [Microvirga ossetica]
MSAMGRSLRMWAAIIIGLSAALWSLGSAIAHDARPAYLEITETAPGRYGLLWRTPLLSGMPLPVRLGLPANVRNVTAPAQRELPDSVVERRLVTVDGGLAGRRIDFIGLQGTITDVLVRTQTLDGDHSTTLVRPSRPWIDIEAAQGPLTIAGAYISHGVEHILLGFDHLLFVLALVLIVRDWRVLLWTVTAFTLAHSITLSLATLGFAQVPGPPVEATIALSILLLTYEIVRIGRGEASLTARWPWVVAFSFGLLHGFGFAGALTELGLPKGDIPLALFSFNVGVELGQLAFIAVVLGVIALARRLPLPGLVQRYALTATTYALGGLAAFWFVERVAGFWT